MTVMYWEGGAAGGGRSFSPFAPSHSLGPFEGWGTGLRRQVDIPRGVFSTAVEV